MISRALPDLMLLLATAYERSGSIDLADKEFADAMKASNFNPRLGSRLRRLSCDGMVGAIGPMTWLPNWQTAGPITSRFCRHSRR